jgi:hypothetical protein
LPVPLIAQIARLWVTADVARGPSRSSPRALYYGGRTNAGIGCTGKTMKYMLMFWVDESAEVTADDDAAMMIAVKSWVEQMTERGVRLYGGPLRSAREARIVHVRDGELLVCDGPFAETKEQIGGYDVVECAGLDAAVGVAAGHPLARTAKVEVRPFWDAPWDH